MAVKKYNWKQIEKDFKAKKYPTLKALAEAHGVEYGYLRKRTANWKSKEKIEKGISYEVDEINKTGDGVVNAPSDKKKAMIDILDKAWIIANMAVSNADNFFTHDGAFRSKQFNDTMGSIEKIGKGYLDFVQDEEKSSNILAYVGMLKEVKNSIKEEDLLED